MSSIRVPITELPSLVEQKSKQTALSNKPVPMSLPINDLSYPAVLLCTAKIGIALGRITALVLCTVQAESSKFVSVLFGHEFQIWVGWN